MKTISFNVKLPDGYYTFSIAKHHKCTIIESGGKKETVISKLICPTQLVYAVKEFNLLNRLRRKVFRFLKQIGSTVLFIVVEPNDGGLIDHAWYVFQNGLSSVSTFVFGKLF